MLASGPRCAGFGTDTSDPQSLSPGAFDRYQLISRPLSKETVTPLQPMTYRDGAWVRENLDKDIHMDRMDEWPAMVPRCERLPRSTIGSETMCVR
jgi:hypothetical protein